MSESGVEWTKYSRAFWRGCEPVSPACDRCYAWARAARFGPMQGEWGKGVLEFGDTQEENVIGARRIIAAHDYWQEPYRWQKKAAEKGVYEPVFMNHLSDFLEDYVGEVVKHNLEHLGWNLHFWRAAILQRIADTPNLIWLILTKRPHNFHRLVRLAGEVGRAHDTLKENGQEMVRAWLEDRVPPGNVWFGVTGENQRWWDSRVGVLWKIPARLRFASAEPMLSEIRISKWRKPDWVICGGESEAVFPSEGVTLNGEPYTPPKARKTEADWVRSLRDQCGEMGIKFWFKQWGEYGETGEKLGKKKTGNSLDGVVMEERPELTVEDLED